MLLGLDRNAQRAEPARWAAADADTAERLTPQAREIACVKLRGRCDSGTPEKTSPPTVMNAISE
jgi:hypothetical protein